MCSSDLGDGDRRLPEVALQGALLDPFSQGIARADVDPRGPGLLRVRAREEIGRASCRERV